MSPRPVCEEAHRAAFSVRGRDRTEAQRRRKPSDRRRPPWMQRKGGGGDNGDHQRLPGSARGDARRSTATRIGQGPPPDRTRAAHCLTERWMPDRHRLPHSRAPRARARSEPPPPLPKPWPRLRASSSTLAGRSATRSSTHPGSPSGRSARSVVGSIPVALEDARLRKSPVSRRGGEGCSTRPRPMT